VNVKIVSYSTNDFSTLSSAKWSKGISLPGCAIAHFLSGLVGHIYIPAPLFTACLFFQLPYPEQIVFVWFHLLRSIPLSSAFG
jgi:hypothetical protein